MLKKYVWHLLAPEGAVAAPPAPPADPIPAAAPAPPVSSAIEGTPVPESPTGSASLIDEMNSMLKGEPKTPDRGEDGKFKPKTPKAADPAKPADPKAADPKAPKEPADPKPIDPNTKDPVALRKRLAEVEGELKKTRSEREAEITKLQSKIKEFESKQFVTPEQIQQQKDREERLRELEAQSAAADFRKTPEYKRDFIDPWQQEWRSAVANVKELFVSPEGEEPRPGTAKDFDAVRNAGSYIQQRNMAKQLFGEEWDVVMTHINSMRGIENRAAQAVATHEQSYETTRQTELTTYQSAYDETDKNLVSTYPQFFGEDPENPEAIAEMQKGLDFIDRALEQSKKSTLAERAAANATIRRWAGAFPRMHFMLGKKDAEIASLKEALAKYRGSDPGAEVGGDGGGGPPKDPNALPVEGGSEAMAAEFDKML